MRLNTVLIALFPVLLVVGAMPALAQTEDICDPVPDRFEIALLGEQRDSVAGLNVVALGDINSDGYGDFAVNAGNFAYQGMPFYGLTYVIYGNPQQGPISLGSLGPSVTGAAHEGFVIAGGGTDLSNDGRIRGMGDLDGDGIDDFAITNPFASTAPGVFPGAVYLFYGRRSDAAAAAFPPEIDLNQIASGVYGDQVRVHFGPTHASGYGLAIQALGDINGDGQSDFAVGRSARALVYFGQGGRPESIQPSLALRQPELSGTLGFGLGGQFDYDSDGINDILVCDTNDDPQGISFGGICYLIWGSVLPSLGPEFIVNQLRPDKGGDGSLGLVFRGGEPAAGIGRNGQFMGTLDLNGDGRVDLVFGSPRAQPEGPGTPDRGRIYVVYGSASRSFVELSLATLARAQPGPNQLGFVLEGAPVTFGQFGKSFASAGDENGDGIDDLLIGAPGDQQCGAITRCGGAWIIFGQRHDSTAAFPPLSLISQETITSEVGYRFGPDLAGSTQQFGGSVESLSDLTGDGKPEWLVGAHLARFGDGIRGKACLYLSSRPLVIQPAPEPIDAGSNWHWLALGGFILVAGLWRAGSLRR